MQLAQKLKKVEAFAKDYATLMCSETIAFDKGRSWEKVRQDWWYALIFFFDRAFYQGRSDDLSGRFEKATILALDSVVCGSSPAEKLLSLKKLSGWLHREQWKRKQNPLWKALSKKYDIGENKEYGTGRERDREMVLDSLRFVVSDCKDCNILEHSIQQIQNHNIADLSRKLQGIISVGDKIASFFLRDTVFIYNLEVYLKPKDYYYLVPIDTWVRKVADKLGMKANAKDIAITCQQNGVSPIRFNQGAWYLGSHSLSLLLDML